MTLEKLRPRLRERHVSKQTQDCFNYFRERAHVFIADLLRSGELSAREQVNALRILRCLAAHMYQATGAGVLRLSLERLTHVDDEVRNEAAKSVRYFVGVWGSAQWFPDEHGIHRLATPLQEEVRREVVVPRLRAALALGLDDSNTRWAERFVYMPDLKLDVRFLRHGTDDGVECREEFLVREERSWTVPAAESALVLVDCWAEHFIRSHEEASGAIIRERLVPVVEAARAAGVAVIHAPSPVWVEAYPQWTAYASDQDLEPVPADAWPPEEFRQRRGEFAQFARFEEPKVKEWLQDLSHYRIHEALGPEPEDFVIATGAQLHRLLSLQKRLHLFYAGFATNICILFRDYGTRAMAQRGYNIILLRDCTTGIEHAETVESQGLTQAAIDTVEVSAGHSITADQFLAACAAASGPR